MNRQRSGHWTAVWLGCAAIVLLSLAAVFLLHSHNRQMQEMREQAAQTRARLMAQSVGQRLAHAISTGIPLDKLAGVPEFLEHWQKNHPEVTQIAVHAPQGQMLWRSRTAEGPHDTHVATGRAELVHNGMVRAHISFEVKNDSIQSSGKAWRLLGPAVLLISALAYLAAHFACAQGPWLRNYGLRTIARWAIRGDYRRLLVLPQHKHFDLRVQEVAHAMRGVHERMARMRQLISSLRRTEPQQLRRDYLDHILKKTKGSDRFTDAEPTITRLVAAQSQSLWMALLLSLGAVSPLTFALQVFQSQSTSGTADRWSSALPAAALTLFILAAAAGWQLFTRLRISTLSVLILSNAALLAPLLAMLLGSEFHPCWLAAWNGCFAGAAMAACTRAQTHPDQHLGFVHVQPYMPGAALLAWWGCLLWLAPALGYYAYESLPNALAELALMLPIACALFFATRWDVVHSPWHVRMAPHPSSHRPGHPQRLLPLGVAAGLVAGKIMHDLTSLSSSSALLLQCALGIGLGLGIIGTRLRAPRTAHKQRPWSAYRWQAIALTAAVLQLATGLDGSLSAWLPWPVQTISLLLLGWLLGHGFAQAATQPQDWATQKLLLCATLGAALCSAAITLGLQAWPHVLAALLLTQIQPRLKQRTKALNAY